MTTSEAEYQGGGGGILEYGCLVIILAVVVVSVLAMLAPAIAQFNTDTSHGVEKHGSAAVRVHDCISRGGTIQIWKNPNTKRTARVCQIGPEIFGIQIRFPNDVDEVTAFIKEKMKTLEQVMKYLRNTGYECISGC